MKDTSKKAATLRILADINAGLCEQGLDGRHGGAVFECSFTHAQARRAWAAFQALARAMAT